nr:butyrophilin-like protein 3 [Loxodonta africana]
MSCLFSCFLSPEMSADAMEVRFFRNQFSTTVHIYRDGKDQAYMQMRAYHGKTEFMKDFIAEGHVLLRVKDITTLDACVYGCWFSWELQVSDQLPYYFFKIMKSLWDCFSETFFQPSHWHLAFVLLGSTCVCLIVGIIIAERIFYSKSQGKYQREAWTSGLFMVQVRPGAGMPHIVS